MKVLYFLISFLACFHLAFSQNTNLIIVPKENREVQMIGKEIYYWEDTTNNTSINTIQTLSNQNKFIRHPKTIFTHSVTKSAFWFKISIDNQSLSDMWLNIGGILSCWEVDLYAPTTTGDFQKVVETGSFRPKTQKAYQANNYWLPLAKSGESQTYYIRIWSGRNYECLFSLGSLETLHQQEKFNLQFAYGFVGIILIMVLYNLFLFFSILDIIYLIYSLYLFSVLFVISYINSFAIFSDYRWLHSYMLIWVTPSYVLAYLFAIKILELRKSPKILFTVSVPIAILLVLFSLNLFGVNVFYLVSIYQILVLIMGLSGVCSGAYCWYKGNENAKFYTLAWSFAIVSIIIYTFTNKGFLPYNLWTRNIMYFGFSTEIFMFSLALANRIRILRKDKIQAQDNILQLIQNQKNLLEQQVEERTVEINQQKQKLQDTLEQLVISRQESEERRATAEKFLKDVTDSINYALRIQNAIIPREIDLQKHLDCFVFFRPRDIVSGDFYWFAKIENTKILVVADCTGHGVSGAFMTMIGNDLLNQIVHNQEIYRPDLIINEMQQLLHKVFAANNEEIADGMDIAIIAIQTLQGLQDLVRFKVEYSGAKIPLYWTTVNNTTQETLFHKIKADRVPIEGRKHLEHYYTLHTISNQALSTDIKNLDNFVSIPKGISTTFYLSSDGYQDQFGAQSKRKLLSANLKKILLEAAPLATEQQKMFISTKFDGWKGNHRQIDDVLVVGIKV